MTWCPICWNWPKKANSGEFPDFQKMSGKCLEKLEFWNSDFKIKLSDINWVGKIPNIMKLAKTRQFPEISRFPENSGKVPEKFGSLIFWVQNQFQWLKSSGNDAPYIEIGEKKQIPENFQISRIFPEKIQKNGKFEILSSKSSFVT